MCLAKWRWAGILLRTVRASRLHFLPAFPVFFSLFASLCTALSRICSLWCDINSSFTLPDFYYIFLPLHSVNPVNICSFLFFPSLFTPCIAFYLSLVSLQSLTLCSSSPCTALFGEGASAQETGSDSCAFSKLHNNAEKKNKSEFQCFLLLFYAFWRVSERKSLCTVTPNRCAPVKESCDARAGSWFRWKVEKLQNPLFWVKISILPKDAPWERCYLLIISLFGVWFTC